MVSMIRLQVLCVAIALLVFSGQRTIVNAADEKPTETSTGAPTEAGTEAADSPEGVLRAFLLAVLSQDAESAQTYSLEDPDFQMLFEGEKRPEDVVAPLKATIGQLPIRQLKVGEKVTLQNKKRITVDAKMVSEDRTQLMAALFPEPVPMRKVDGIWKVDPRPIIAAGKSASQKKRK
ncbi:hypothetical protein [Planctomicrobium sp. SH527]|uniref:hypothetical protein n=1 Tax=Planctomicrobium sp. SH527 TaxID=3448123 RepID=UPI003F5C5174